MRQEIQMNEKDYQRIMDWINRNSKDNGYITETGLKKFIKKLRRESAFKFATHNISTVSGVKNG